MATSGWKERLKKERRMLVKALDKLTLFMGSEEFTALPGLDQVLLKEQMTAMTQYLGVLDRRVRRLK